MPIDRATEMEPLLTRLAHATPRGARPCACSMCHPSRTTPSPKMATRLPNDETACPDAKAGDELRGVEVAFDGAPVEPSVHFDDPLEEIVLEGEVFDADLITMASRQPSWLRRLVAPGLADRVARGPVLH